MSWCGLEVDFVIVILRFFECGRFVDFEGCIVVVNVEFGMFVWEVGL